MAKKFSYSKLNTFESCGWKYKLQYVDGHYISADSLAIWLGLLVHGIEEEIARTIQMGGKPDYEQLKDKFQNAGLNAPDRADHRSTLLGINVLKEKFKDDFFQPDEHGASYYTRTLEYLDYGIHRLERYLANNPNLEVYGIEQFFSINFQGNVLSGYIDRVFRDRVENVYYVEDIKTRNKLFRETELVTPLQFVIYVYALAENLGLDYSHFRCAYDLPFLDIKQAAGTAGFVPRGIKKMREIFTEIKDGNFIPSPSPLCHWCQFCPTNPEQPEEGKLLCPYYSLWTRENRVHTVAHKWEGIERHPAIMADEIRCQTNAESKTISEFDF